MAYQVRELLAHPSTYTRGRGGHPVDHLAVHYTGSQAGAENNCVYFSGGNRGASAHYFLDGSGTIWRSVPEADTAWAVGNFGMNQRGVSIEVVSDGRDFSEAEIAELRWLVRDLMARHGVPADRVIRHYDAVDLAARDGVGGAWVDPHKACPAPYVDDSKWQALWAEITAPCGAGEGDDMFTDEDRAVLAQLARTDDPTGRGTALEMYGRVCWLGAKADRIIEAQAAIDAKLDELLAKVGR